MLELQVRLGLWWTQAQKTIVSRPGVVIDEYSEERELEIQF